MKKLEEMSAEECIQLGEQIYNKAKDEYEDVRQRAGIYWSLQALYKQTETLINQKHTQITQTRELINYIKIKLDKIDNKLK